MPYHFPSHTDSTANSICLYPFNLHTLALVKLLIYSLPSHIHSLSHYQYHKLALLLFQFSSVSQLCPTLCGHVGCSTPGLPVHHQLPELTQTHVHGVGDATQPSHPLSSPYPPAFNLSQHQGLFQWVSSSHQVAKALELQLQHQSFQWIFRIDFV